MIEVLFVYTVQNDNIDFKVLLVRLICLRNKDT